MSAYAIDTTPVSAATVTASSVGAEQLAGERLPPVVVAARAHARAPADEAAEVLGLGQRTLGAGRGDLERVALAHRRRCVGHALAQVERDAVGMVDEEAHEAAADDLGEQHLDVGLGLGEPGLDIGLDRAHVHLLSHEKSGRAPAFRNYGRRPRKLCACYSTEIGARLRGRRPARGRGRCGSRAGRGAATRPARAAGAPRRGGRAASARGRGRTARSRWSARARRRPRTPRARASNWRERK